MFVIALHVVVVGVVVSTWQRKAVEFGFWFLVLVLVFGFRFRRLHFKIGHESAANLSASSLCV